MKLILFGLASAVLATSAVAQSSVNSQTSTSAQSDTSVKASQSGVNASSQNSNSASHNSTVSTQGKKSGSNSGSGVPGSSHTQAGANASGVATFPSGINIPAVLSKSLDSKKNKEGDEVTAKTTADVLSQGQIIIPRNSKLIGHVTQARAKAKGESDSALGIAFDRAILKDGHLSRCPVANVAAH